jgi:hypothetical protein
MLNLNPYRKKITEMPYPASDLSEKALCPSPPSGHSQATPIIRTRAGINQSMPREANCLIIFVKSIMTEDQNSINY